MIRAFFFSYAGLLIIQQYLHFICLSMLIFHYRKTPNTSRFVDTPFLKNIFPLFYVFLFLGCHRNKPCWEIPGPVPMQRTFVLLSKQTPECMKVLQSCKHNRGSQMSQNCFLWRLHVRSVAHSAWEISHDFSELLVIPADNQRNLFSPECARKCFNQSAIWLGPLWRHAMQ